MSNNDGLDKRINLIKALGEIFEDALFYPFKTERFGYVKITEVDDFLDKKVIYKIHKILTKEGIDDILEKRSKGEQK
jgi:hypothetical protein